MITTKQRAFLRSLAAEKAPVTQIGKNGVTEPLIKTLSDALEAHELIKVHLLPAAGEDGGNVAENLAELLGAEVVTVIGRKAVLYRRSEREDFEHIAF